METPNKTYFVTHPNFGTSHHGFADLGESVAWAKDKGFVAVIYENNPHGGSKVVATYDPFSGVQYFS